MKVDIFQYKLYIALQLSKTCWSKQSAVPLLNTPSNSVILTQCNEWEKKKKTKNNHVLNRYKVIDDWSTFMSGFSLSMLKDSKMNSLVQFLAVPSILGFAKSILWSKFQFYGQKERWLVTSVFLHFSEPGLCLLSRVSKFLAVSPM